MEIIILLFFEIWVRKFGRLVLSCANEKQYNLNYLDRTDTIQLSLFCNSDKELRGELSFF
jgi:hypothetical protein